MKFKLKNYKFGLLIACIVLNAIGVLFVASASSQSSRVVTRQIIGSFAGVAVCIIGSFIDYRKVLRIKNLMYGLGCILLISIFIVGTAFGKNAVRWIEVPFVGQVQPAEFMKFVLIIILADYLAQKDVTINKIKNIFVLAIIYGIPAFLVLMQPNLSCVIIISVITLSMFITSKIKTRFLIFLAGIVVIFFTLFYLMFKTGLLQKIPLIKSYQIERIETFFDPGAHSEGNYQQENSLRAIGSGRMVGKGYNNDSTLSVKNAGWLAEETNDFIFAVVGEEVGFRGAFFILCIFLYVVINCFLIAYRARDEVAKYICVGAGTWIGFQTFVNVGVAIRLLPNTGVPLPFFSQGLSSLMSVYLAMGIVLNIAMNTTVYKAKGVY